MGTNHESHGRKPSRHVEMFATKSVTSPLQTRLCRSNGIWSLCLELVPDFVAKSA